MSNELAIQEVIITNDQMELIKKTIAPDATPDELQLFIYDCKRQGVHPLDKMIYFTKRKAKQDGKEVYKYTPITSIDFMRARSIDTNLCAGNDDPVFHGEPKTDDFKATVTVYRIVQGQRCAFTATARWGEYYPGDFLGFMWKSKPHVMLGKVAEALALRKAFPRELKGMYSTEEMDQANVKEPIQMPKAKEVVMHEITPLERQQILGPAPELAQAPYVGNKPEPPKELTVREKVMDLLMYLSDGDPTLMDALVSKGTEWKTKEVIKDGKVVEPSRIVSGKPSLDKVSDKQMPVLYRFLQEEQKRMESVPS